MFPFISNKKGLGNDTILAIRNGILLVMLMIIVAIIFNWILIGFGIDVFGLASAGADSIVESVTIDNITQVFR